MPRVSALNQLLAVMLEEDEVAALVYMQTIAQAMNMEQNFTDIQNNIEVRKYYLCHFKLLSVYLDNVIMLAFVVLLINQRA